MAVDRTGVGSVNIVRLDVPGACGGGVVEEAVGVRAAALVASAGARALVDGEGVLDVLLLDDVGLEGLVVDVVGGVGVGGAFSALLGGLVGGGHGSVEGGEVAHHALVLLLLVGVDGLGMLAEVVEARELLAAMAGEGALAGMFSET